MVNFSCFDWQENSWVLIFVAMVVWQVQSGTIVVGFATVD